MKVWFMNWLDNPNPILLKEIRQSTQGRAFRVLLQLCIVAQMIMAVLVMNHSNGFNSGSSLFNVIMFPLLIMAALVIPLQVGAKFQSDSEGDSLELLYTTTVSPASIVMGKVLAGFINTLVLILMSTPWLTFGYLLGGVNLIQVGVSVVVLCLLSLFLCTAYVFVGFMTTVAAIRRVFSVLLILASLQFAGLAVELIGSEYAFRRLLGEGNFSVIFGISVIVALCFLGLAFFGAVAQANPIYANRSRLLRWFLAGTIVLISGLGVGASLIYGDTDPLAAVCLICPFMIWGTVFLMINEPLNASFRVIAEVKASRIPRWINYSFTAGPVNALCLGTSLTFLILISTAVVYNHFGQAHKLEIDDPWGIGLAISLYSASYCIIGTFFRHFVMEKGKPMMTAQVIAVIVVLVATILPVLMMVVSRGGGSGELMMFSPFYIGVIASSYDKTKILIPALVLFLPSFCIYLAILSSSAKAFLKACNGELKYPTDEDGSNETVAEATEAMDGEKPEGLTSSSTTEVAIEMTAGDELEKLAVCEVQGGAE